jgi:membrane associated rhomboid family serine protease
VNAAGGPGLKTSYVMPYLRALGEMGDVSRLLATYARLPRPLRHLRAVRLVVLAFAGRPDLLRLLFETPLARDPTPAKSYWLAVAEQAAGDLANAAKRLEALRDGEFLREQVNQRLVTPAPRVEPADLLPEARNALAELEREIVDARVLGPEGPPRRAIATFALMGVLVVVFVVEAVFGKIDADHLIEVDTLIRLGALVLPPEGGAGWRVIAAGFLHVNETHLAMNLLGLWVLGPLVERTSGPLGTLVGFVVSSVGAYATALFFMHTDVHHHAVALGASAGVFGLVGALASFAATGYLLQGNRLLGRQLGGIAAIVGIQLIFDAYHPGVSTFLHLAGAGWGALVALPYALYTFRATSGKGARG